MNVNGGAMLTGWMIWLWPNIMLEAEAHAIWVFTVKEKRRLRFLKTAVWLCDYLILTWLPYNFLFPPIDGQRIIKDIIRYVLQIARRDIFSENLSDMLP